MCSAVGRTVTMSQASTSCNSRTAARWDHGSSRPARRRTSWTVHRESVSALGMLTPIEYELRGPNLKAVA